MFLKAEPCSCLILERISFNQQIGKKNKIGNLILLLAENICERESSTAINSYGTLKNNSSNSNRLRMKPNLMVSS